MSASARASARASASAETTKGEVESQDNKEYQWRFFVKLYDYYGGDHYSQVDDPNEILHILLKSEKNVNYESVVIANTTKGDDYIQCAHPKYDKIINIDFYKIEICEDTNKLSLKCDIRGPFGGSKLVANMLSQCITLEDNFFVD